MKIENYCEICPYKFDCLLQYKPEKCYLEQ